MKQNTYEQDEQLSLSLVTPLWKKTQEAYRDKYGFPDETPRISKLPSVNIDGVWHRISEVAYDGYLYHTISTPAFPDELYLDIAGADATIIIKNLSSLLKKFPNARFKNIEYTIVEDGREKVQVGNISFSKAN